MILSVNEKSISEDIFNDKKISFLYTFEKRGVYEVPKLNIKSTFPFGIINTFGKISFQEKIYVFPKPIKPPEDIFQKLYDKKKMKDLIMNLIKLRKKRYSKLIKNFLETFHYQKEILHQRI